MKHILALSLLVFPAFLGHAQQSETRSLDSFVAIEVGEAIELIMTKGNKNEAVIEVDDISLDEVVTEVRGSELKIERESGNNRYNNNRSGQVVIRLTYMELDELSVNSAASVYSKSVIKVDKFKVRISSAGTAELELDVTDLDAEVSSAGTLEVSGKCASMDLDGSSAGRFEGYDLICGAIDADMSSGGSGEVFVKNKLKVDAGTGGSLYYKGDPEKVLADTNLGGRVQRR